MSQLLQLTSTIPIWYTVFNNGEADTLTVQLDSYIRATGKPGVAFVVRSA